MSDRFTQEAIVTRADNTIAILHFAQGQELAWQRKDLPENTVPGTHLFFTINTVESEGKERSKLAAVILNELLTP